MTRDEMEQGKKLKKRRYYDYTLLFLVLFLVCFGLVMVYSVSYYNANKYYNDPTLFLRKQAIFAAVGTVVMLTISKIDYRIYVSRLPFLPVKPIFLLYLMCFGLQLYLVLFGASTGGSQRWIELGSMGKFQPSEITKICVLLFTSYLVKLAPRRLDSIRGFFRILLIMAPLIGLVAWENFSTALVTGVILVSICFVSSRKKGYYLWGLLALVAVFALLIIFFPYRGERFDIWMDIENHPKGYQILQGLYAIASGGLFGKGLGQGIQKLGYIPEAHNDMIFSVICEELGMVGAFAVLFRTAAVADFPDCDQRAGALRKPDCDGSYGAYCRAGADQCRRGNKYHTVHGYSAAVYQLRGQLAACADGGARDCAERLESHRG